MDNKRKFVTPKDMIAVYKQLEQKLPKRPFSCYKPTEFSPVNGSFTESQLSQEAVCMMNFLGLTGYSAEVKYEEMEKHAGYILFPERISEKMVHIRVSSKFKTSRTSLIAILAHEICHKLLPVYGLDTSDEVMVDLCTIYVGFGDVVLQGYFDNSSGKEILQMGYLERWNYKVAAQLVNVVRGRMSLEKAGFEDVDVLMTDTLKMWLSCGGEREAVKHLLRSYEQQKAELLRNINLLEQCLDEIKMLQKLDFQQYSRRFGTFLRGNEGDNAMHVVDLLYQKQLQMPDIESAMEPVVDPGLLTINHAINTLLFELHKNKNFALNYKVVCPACGKTSPAVNHDKILKCSSTECGCYFFHKGEPWNATVYRRIDNQKRLEEAAERNKLIEQRISVAQAEAAKKVADAKMNARKEVEEIRQNEIKRYRETVTRRTPALLRWFLRKYL